ncbi:adenylate/guanylate cyclase domain-containing protein [Motiliproteus sp. MSK22-1]|uniref:adenylate/guanylate cyclase domain-containing protein n=1 Tax=Motiliproteus sp. MSK22-1 TaxID=1897630 RepID=UPI000975DD69|nr:adenylate/guanylate cyclase domain-containing protein [Motiliproteus sp. MSK22-1]OMH31791.1 hypothetical protein BGP75_16890 [Motiliproteus sp. MSK22-1]
MNIDLNILLSNVTAEKFVLAFIFSILFGFGYSVLVSERIIFGVVNGAFLGVGVFLFESMSECSKYIKRIKQGPLLSYMAFQSFVWTLIVGLSLWISHSLLRALDVSLINELQDKHFLRHLLFCFFVVLVINYQIRLAQFFGYRVLTNILLGRYNNPKHENKIFMFMDIKDSTRLTETIGDYAAQNMISSFFFDISSIIVRNGGEIHRYIGDEVVVIWDYNEHGINVDYLRCLSDINDYVNSKKSYYQKKYGAFPEYRVGMHAGKVIASEVGDHKREIVYFGDTINTASRIQKACKEVEKDFLISKELLNRSQIPSDMCSQYIGRLPLAGKKSLLDVFSLS